MSLLREFLQNVVASAAPAGVVAQAEEWIELLESDALLSRETAALELGWDPSGCGATDVATLEHAGILRAAFTIGKHSAYRLSDVRALRGISIRHERPVTYFFEDDAEGLMKIGRSTVPAARLNTLSKQYARALLDRGWTRLPEREVHRQFAGTRRTHPLRCEASTEWFDKTEELLTFIAAHREGFVMPEVLRIARKESAHA